MTMLMDGAIEAPRGLKGVVVAETGIGDVRGEEGYYHYRGRSATGLAEQHTLEEVWQLLFDGVLPADAESSRRFAAEIGAARQIPEQIARLLPGIAAVADPLDGLRSAVVLWGSVQRLRPVIDLSPNDRRTDALRLCAVVPTLLCALHRLRSGRQPVAPRPDLGVSANYLWMMTGREPTAAQARAVEQYLISTIDHGFNASTFTARVVASTGADVGACVVAAIGALSGPLHGGAPSRALDLIDEIGSADRIDAVIGDRARRGGADHGVRPRRCTAPPIPGR